MRRGGAAVEERSGGRVKSLLYLSLRNEQSSLWERVCRLSPGFTRLRLPVCKKKQKKTFAMTNSIMLTAALQPLLIFFNYNALLLQSQGCIEESMNRVLASGASFIFFYPSEATKFLFERAQMRPQPVLVDLWTCEPLPVCVLLVSLRDEKGLEPRLFSAQPGRRGKKKKTTTLQQKESWRDGGKTGDEEGSGLKMQRWCRAWLTCRC